MTLRDALITLGKATARLEDSPIGQYPARLAEADCAATDAVTAMTAVFVLLRQEFGFDTAERIYNLFDHPISEDALRAAAERTGRTA